MATKKTEAEERLEKRKAERKERESKVREEMLVAMGSRTYTPADRDAYTPEMGQYIASLIATTPFGITELCKRYKKEGFPSERSIWSWMWRYPDFHELYYNAKRIQIAQFIEEIMNIADNKDDDYIEDENGRRVNMEHIQRSKLRIDTRKWLAIKLAPKIYGDSIKVDDESRGNALVSLRNQLDELIKRNEKDY